MDECCCDQGGPATLQIARAVSILTVQVFSITSKPGNPFFCGRGFFRQCNVTGTDNGQCGPVGSFTSSATVPIFAQNITGGFEPCNTNLRLLFGDGTITRIGYSDGGMGCALFTSSLGQECWGAGYELSVETTVTDLIAACLANLSLIDLNALPFGTQRTVRNDFFTGSPFFSDSPLLTSPPLPDACAGLFGHQLASSFAFRYANTGTSFFCINTGGARVEMPTRQLIATASRSRFSTSSTWCKRTHGPVLVDPDFTSNCLSTAGACAQTACVHHMAASGVIDVPEFNTSVHIALCTTPAAPCNATPIAF